MITSSRSRDFPDFNLTWAHAFDSIFAIEISSSLILSFTLNTRVRSLVSSPLLVRGQQQRMIKKE